MILLGERLRKHANRCRKPSFREESGKLATCTVLINFGLNLLKLHPLSCLGIRLNLRVLLLHIFLESILVRNHQENHVRVLIVVENHL